MKKKFVKVIVIISLVILACLYMHLSQAAQKESSLRDEISQLSYEQQLALYILALTGKGASNELNRVVAYLTQKYQDK